MLRKACVRPRHAQEPRFVDGRNGEAEKQNPRTWKSDDGRDIPGLHESWIQRQGGAGEGCGRLRRRPRKVPGGDRPDQCRRRRQAALEGDGPQRQQPAGHAPGAGDAAGRRRQSRQVRWCARQPHAPQAAVRYLHRPQPGAARDHAVGSGGPGVQKAWRRRVHRADDSCRGYRAFRKAGAAAEDQGRQDHAQRRCLRGDVQDGQHRRQHVRLIPSRRHPVYGRESVDQRTEVQRGHREADRRRARRERRCRRQAGRRRQEGAGRAGQGRPQGRDDARGAFRVRRLRQGPGAGAGADACRRGKGAGGGQESRRDDDCVLHRSRQGVCPQQPRHVVHCVRIRQAPLPVRRHRVPGEEGTGRLRSQREQGERHHHEICERQDRHPEGHRRGGVRCRGPRELHHECAEEQHLEGRERRARRQGSRRKRQHQGGVQGDCRSPRSRAGREARRQGNCRELPDVCADVLARDTS